VIGDKRKFLSALIVPNFEELQSWAKEQGLPYEKIEILLVHEDVKKHYRNVLDDMLQEFDRHERIVEFSLLPEEMTEASGLLTPTLKVKRRQVTEKFADDINKMYGK